MKAASAMQAILFAAGAGIGSPLTARLVFAEETEETETQRNSVIWIGQGEGTSLEAVFLNGQKDQIYLGSYYQSDTSGETKDPVLWNVLEAGEDSLYLLAAQVLDAKEYQSPHATSISWETCTLRSWLNSDTGFLGTAFSEIERNALAATEVTYDKSAQGDDLASCVDTVTILSYAEALNTDYGFDKRPVDQSELRIAYYTAYSAEKLGATVDTAAKWWLRSLGTNIMNASFVDTTGKVLDYQSSYLDAADTTTAVRPATWLSESAVVYVTADDTDKTGNFSETSMAESGEGAIWYIAVSDGNEDFQAECEETSAAVGDTISVTVTSLGDDVYAQIYTQITAVLLDEDGTVLALGKAGDAQEGELEIALPDDISGESCTLKVFAECVHAGQEGEESWTDFCSNVTEFAIELA
ncbi:MAG: DUF6273 domain-containing protein [Lachnospiraceae bacterium]|nr:DUF6273 domain-containing protein [Lachnospiraceae bacterium]